MKKRICTRRVIASLLVFAGFSQASGVLWAVEGQQKVDIRNGSMGLAHIKSNQLDDLENPVLKPRDSLFDITQLADQSYLMVGNDGLIIKASKKQAAERLDSNINHDLFSTHATKQGDVFLGGANGSLYKSNDHLTNWSKQIIAPNESIFNFIELSTAEVLLSGSYGLLMSSRPPYQQWEAVNIPWADFLKEAWNEFGEAAPHLYAGCTNQRDELLVVGEFGLALKRDTDGQWSKIHGGAIEPAIYGCQLSNNGKNIILVGQQGMVYQTSNGGDSWVEKSISKGSDLYKVEKIKDLFIILGDKKKIYTSLTSSDWVCQRFIGDRPLGWFVDMAVQGEDIAIIGSNGGFKVTSYASFVTAINQLNNSKELVSCE